MTTPEVKIKNCSKASFCWAISKYLKDSTKQYKGLVVSEFLNTKDFTSGGSIAGYRPDSKAKMVALNFCPFCGFDFQPLLKSGEYVGFGGEL